MIENWPVPTAAAAVVRADGTVLGTHGPTAHRFPLASVTKPLAAYAALVAYEEGAIELDEPAGPEGSTVRHLLAHTSGLAFDEHRVTAAARHAAAVLQRGLRGARRPHRQGDGHPVRRVSAPGGAGAAGHDVDDAGRLARQGRRLDRRRPGALRRRGAGAPAAGPAYGRGGDDRASPGHCKGVLPGYGHQNPNDWGLGFEIRDSKSPHWTGSSSSPRTFGHFGQSGTFLWIDPDAGAACVALTDRAFGPWAVEAWPPFTDAVLAELR